MIEDKILIISGTNRKKSTSLKVAKEYQAIIKTHYASSDVLSLEEIPHDFLESVLYKKGKPEVFHGILQKVIEADKFIFIVPEYNGSFPGVLKLFIDGLEYPHSFKGKKGALVGISDGTQGSAMGMSHLSDILNYLGMSLLALRPRLIDINSQFSQSGLNNQFYKELIAEQAKSLLEF